MAEIERTRRPFWIHQVIEYVIGIALISAAVQLPNPTIPAVLGLLIVLNAAIAKGSAGAFRVAGRRTHRALDLVVIAVLVVFAVQPWVSLDVTGRLMIGAIAFIMWFVWFHTDFDERVSRGDRRADRRAAGSEAPRDSTEIGRQAGRLVGGAAASAKRWKDGWAATDDDSGDGAPPANWDPPQPG